MAAAGPASDHYYGDDGFELEEDIAEYDEAMALNAKLKALLASGVDDPAAAAEIFAMAQGVGGGVAAGGAGPAYHDERYYEEEAPRRRAPRRAGMRTTKSRPRMGASASRGRDTGRRNYTFTEDSLNQIGRSNLRLMQNLTSINSGKGVMQTRERKVKIRSSAAINRRRRGKTIQNDNAAFLKRLQNVKPSKSLSRRTMKKDARRQKKFADNCRTVGVKKKKKKKRLPSLDDRANGPGMQF